MNHEWTRSSFCDGGGCVEVRQTWYQTVEVRTSQDHSFPLELAREEWRHFVAGVKAGEFDLGPDR